MSEISFVVRHVGGTPTAPQVRESIHVMNIATGERREVATLDGQEVLECRWSNDGMALALILRDVAAGESHSLRLFDSRSGKIRVLPSLGPIIGRGTKLDDEFSVEWSRDDRSLLVVDTALQATESILLVDALSGQTKLAVSGTNARLSPDDETVYFRERATDPARSPRWFRMNTRTRARSPLDATPGSHHAALSRDGRYLAHVLGENPPEMALYVYDLIAGKESLLVRGFSDPSWVTPNELIATALKSCTDPKCDSPFVATGTSRVEVAGGSAPLELGSSMRPNVDVLYR